MSERSSLQKIGVEWLRALEIPAQPSEAEQVGGTGVETH
jgi:hypothetical protein